MKSKKIFEEKIALYTSFIEEKKVVGSSVAYYQQEIDNAKYYIELLNENKMTPEIFAKLHSRDRWDVSKLLKNVTWLCSHCQSNQGKKRPERMWDGSRHCTECDNELTRRTGGGQSDPFNYTFKK